MENQGRHSSTKAPDEKTLKIHVNVDEKIELRMRVIANHLIDHILGIQDQATRNGLNINNEKDILIMEHQKEIN